MILFKENLTVYIAFSQNKLNYILLTDENVDYKHLEIHCKFNRIDVIERSK